MFRQQKGVQSQVILLRCQPQSVTALEGPIGEVINTDIISLQCNVLLRTLESWHSYRGRRTCPIYTDTFVDQVQPLRTMAVPNVSAFPSSKIPKVSIWLPRTQSDRASVGHAGTSPICGD